MAVEIVPIQPRHITAFREVLDGVAREGRYLALLEAPAADRVRRVELMVRVDNAPAIGLYRRFGFVVEGTCSRYMRVDAEWFDALLMARLL